MLASAVLRSLPSGGPPRFLLKACATWRAFLKGSQPRSLMLPASKAMARSPHRQHQNLAAIYRRAGATWQGRSRTASPSSRRASGGRVQDLWIGLSRDLLITTL